MLKVGGTVVKSLAFLFMNEPSSKNTVLNTMRVQGARDARVPERMMFFDGTNPFNP